MLRAIRWGIFAGYVFAGMYALGLPVIWLTHNYERVNNLADDLNYALMQIIGFTLAMLLTEGLRQINWPCGFILTVLYAAEICLKLYSGTTTFTWLGFYCVIAYFLIRATVAAYLLRRFER